ncbi:MAG: PEP-CTERM sorting domain-containing protein [Phycisphaerales bacterium]
MNFEKKNIVTLAAIAGGLCASVASADVVLVSMTFDDLAGSYSTATSTFTASAVDTARLRTSGDVSRLVDAEGTSTFSPGFVSQADQGNFVMSVGVGALAFDGTRAGSGVFTTTDADGDTIVGAINGTWRNLGLGFIAFDGVLSQVFVNDNGAQDGTFNGSNGGAWDLDLPALEPYRGALVQLVLGANGFFAQNFSNRATGVTAQIVPAPGAMALVGLGMIAAGRRRR